MNKFCYISNSRIRYRDGSYLCPVEHKIDPEYLTVRNEETDKRKAKNL
jgi:hypothetical protein